MSLKTTRRDLMKKLAIAAGAAPAIAWGERVPSVQDTVDAQWAEIEASTSFGLAPIKQEGKRTRYDGFQFHDAEDES